MSAHTLAQINKSCRLSFIVISWLIVMFSHKLTEALCEVCFSRSHPTLLLSWDGHALELFLNEHLVLHVMLADRVLSTVLQTPADGHMSWETDGRTERQTDGRTAETHSRSAALSIFMKSCLARSRISGSSLEGREAKQQIWVSNTHTREKTVWITLIDFCKALSLKCSRENLKLSVEQKECV